MSRPDYSLRYEYLARAVFDCGRCEDPNGYANADLYDHNAHGDHITERMCDALTAILAEMQENSEVGGVDARFTSLHRMITDAENNVDVDAIIDKATTLACELGYSVMDV